MGHEILARMAAGIGEAIGKPVRLRQQHEPHIVVDEGRDDHQIRLDRLLGAARPIITDADRLARAVRIHMVTHGAGDQFQVLCQIRFRRLGHADAGPRAHVAPEGLAKSAVSAPRPILVILGDDRTRRGKGMVSEIPRRLVEDGTFMLAIASCAARTDRRPADSLRAIGQVFLL